MEFEIGDVVVWKFHPDVAARVFDIYFLEKFGTCLTLEYSGGVKSDYLASECEKVS